MIQSKVNYRLLHMNMTAHQFLTTKEQVFNWLNQMNIKGFIIHNDLTVDVHNYVDISNKKLKFLPVQFGIILGDFNCSQNQLKSLQGSPKEVYGYLDCHENRLTNFNFLPSKITGSILAYKNKIKSLEGLPEEVKGDLSLWQNKIKNIKYFPKLIKGSVDISFNQIKTLKNINTHIDAKFDCTNNPLHIILKDIKNLSIQGKVHFYLKDYPKLKEKEYLDFDELKLYLEKESFEKELKIENIHKKSATVKI